MIDQSTVDKSTEIWLEKNKVKENTNQQRVRIRDVEMTPKMEVHPPRAVCTPLGEFLLLSQYNSKPI